MHEPGFQAWHKSHSQQHHDTASDVAGTLRFLLKLPILPFYLPLWLRERRKTRQEMFEFAEERHKEGVSEPMEIALLWIEAQQQEYQRKRRTPPLLALEKTFRKIVGEIATSSQQHRIYRPE